MSQRSRKPCRKRGGAVRNPALALNWLDQNGAGSRANRRLHRVDIAEGNRVEAFDLRTKTLEIFGIARRGDCRERASVKSPGKSDDSELFRMSAGRLIFARCLDRAFDGFRARIGEKHVVREADLDEAPGQTFRFRDLKQIGDMPDFRALFMERVK